MRNNEYPRFEDVTSPFDIVFDTIINKAFEFKNWFISKSVELQSIQSLFDRQAPFISIVAVKWKKGNGGHVFNVIRTDNETYVVDCQEKKVELASTSKYLDKNEIDYNDSFVLDMTHAVLDRELIDISFGLSNKKFFLNGNGPYKSIIEGLAKLDTANTTYTVLVNNTVIGRIRCDIRTDESYNFIDTSSIEDRKYYVYKYHWVSCNIPSTESLSTEAINAKVEQNIVESKMYFANNNGKIPKDVNGNIVLAKNIIDATIYAAFDQFNDSKVAMACKGFVQYKNGTNKHVLMVHGDDSLTEPEEMDCVGTIYSVTLSEPIEFRYHGHRGFGKCQLPKIYTVNEEALKDAQIKKEESVKFKATFEYEKSLTMQHTTEDLDIEVDLLQEFNAGIEEFNHWVRDLELKYLKDELDDEQVTMAFEQIAQENILTDTVKTIFRKIGEFIGWFLRKLKELWNYFFGKTQRATRALKAANERITRHNNSNGFFNDAAFNGSKAPQGLVNAIGLDKFITMGFSPDEFYTLFNEMLDMWASHPEDLYEEIFVRFNQSPTTHKWHTLIGILPTGSGSNAMDAIKFTKSKYPASGTMRESAYDKESVIILLKEAMDAVIAYEKNSKLIASKGNIAAEAAKRVMEYQDRTDITEHEAMQMAKEIQELGNYLQVVFKCYQKAYEFILEQTNEVAKVYLQFMK